MGPKGSRTVFRHYPPLADPYPCPKGYGSHGEMLAAEAPQGLPPASAPVVSSEDAMRKVRSRGLFPGQLDKSIWMTPDDVRRRILGSPAGATWNYLARKVNKELGKRGYPYQLREWEDAWCGNIAGCRQ